MIVFGIVCLCLGQVLSMNYEKEYTYDGRNVDPKEDAPYCGPMELKLSDADKTEFVRAHNDARRRELASDMLRMEWDDDIARIAQYKANTCGFFHSMHTDCNQVALGQNLYMNYPIWDRTRYLTINYTVVTFKWADEREDWNSTSRTCRKGKKCGHWLAVTGAKARKVGCGKAACPRLDVDGVAHENANFVVCNYSPFFTGFERGRSCSNCARSTADLEEKGHTCETDLCVPCDPRKSPQCKCGQKYSCRNGGQYSAEICGCKCPREYYGPYCESPCRCVDLNPRLCVQWATECTNEMHKYWLFNICQKTCKTCSDYKRPASCDSQ